MFVFGWRAARPYGVPRLDEGHFHWMPVMEQVEMFPGVDCPERVCELDRVDSVSALDEDEDCVYHLDPDEVRYLRSIGYGLP